MPFLIDGIVASREPMTGQSTTQIAFLIQIWGGLGLILLFLMLFGINAWVWHRTKINYTFIFEFDTKHQLDYRQYLEVSSLFDWLIRKLSSLLSFLGCVLFWLTFRNFWPQTINATRYPLIFVCICMGILILPFRILHRSSRAWFFIANVYRCPCYC